MARWKSMAAGVSTTTPVMSHSETTSCIRGRELLKDSKTMIRPRRLKTLENLTLKPRVLKGHDQARKWAMTAILEQPGPSTAQRSSSMRPIQA